VLRVIPKRRALFLTSLLPKTKKRNCPETISPNSIISYLRPSPEYVPYQLTTWFLSYGLLDRDSPSIPRVSNRPTHRHFERSRPTFSPAFAPANASVCGERNLSSPSFLLRRRKPAGTLLNTTSPDIQNFARRLQKVGNPGGIREQTGRSP
jgi:hypothetical protein